MIIASGMLFSFTLITGKIDNGAIVPSNQSFQNIYDIGQAGFAMMVAYAIGSKPAFTLALMAEGIYGPNGAFRMYHLS
mgnify:CR=1 FL=1